MVFGMLTNFSQTCLIGEDVLGLLISSIRLISSSERERDVFSSYYRDTTNLLPGSSLNVASL